MYVYVHVRVQTLIFPHYLVILHQDKSTEVNQLLVFYTSHVFKSTLPLDICFQVDYAQDYEDDFEEGRPCRQTSTVASV